MLEYLPLILGAIASIAAGVVAGVLYARIAPIGAGGKADPAANGKEPKGLPPARRYDYEHYQEVKRIDELGEANRQLTNLLVVTLPGLTMKINEIQNERDVPPLLGDAVTRLIIPPPELTLVFRRSAENEKELVLAHKVAERGEIPDHLRISMEEGRIGRALAKRIALDQEDYGREDHLKPIGACKADAFFTTDICAPIIYGDETLGAVSVTGFKQYNQNAKKMLIVAANLGALAIVNARMFQQIQRMADCDNLTQLYNKRYLFKRMESELENARVSGKPLSLFMFDLDNFKCYNDTNGHQAGDECLRQTGKLILSRKREKDTAARYGGEEFILILPETNKDGAYALAENVRKAIQDYQYPNEEKQPLKDVTISGGVSTYPEDGYSAELLIEHADACLYRAKQNGRNAICR